MLVHRNLLNTVELRGLCEVQNFDVWQLIDVCLCKGHFLNDINAFSLGTLFSYTN